MLDHIMAFLPVSILSGLILYFLIKEYIKHSQGLGLISEKHIFSLREDQVPTSAGLLISSVFIISSSLFDVLDFDQLLLFSVIPMIMSIIGFVDDKYNLSSKIKFFLQSLIVIFILLLTQSYDFVLINIYLNEYLAMTLIFIASLWIINTFNFIDGADGLLSTNVILLSISTSLLLFLGDNHSLSGILILLATLMMCFVLFNWFPAKIFMGDSGSLFLGTFFVCLSIYSIVNFHITVFTWMVLLSLFYIETTVTMIMRLYNNKKIFSTRHNFHAYQQITIDKDDHALPAKISIFLQVFWVIPASLISFFFFEDSYLFTLLAVSPLLFLFYWFGPRNALLK